ncbi:MAG: AAA family ATPase [Endozoicomonas sp.]
MREQLRVLMLGHEPQDLERLGQLLAQVVEIRSEQLLLTADTAIESMLQSSKPHVALYCMGGDDEVTLRIIQRAIRLINAELLVVGPANDMDAMRRAMHAGARDYLGSDFRDEELFSALETIYGSLDQQPAGKNARLTTFLPVSGGSGATTLACNLGHALAQSGRNTLLLDVMGTSLQYLDLNPEYGTEDVLEHIDTIDMTALEGYLTVHSSGLKVLATRQTDPLTDSPVSRAQLLHLVNLLYGACDELLIDLPVYPGPSGAHALQQADKVMLVLQQEVAPIFNAASWVEQITRELGVDIDKIQPVVNRYSRKNDISLQEIGKAIGISDLATVPEDYQKVSQSLNKGKTLLQHVPRSEVSKAIVDLHLQYLTEEEAAKARTKSGLGARLFPRRA